MLHPTEARKRTANETPFCCWRTKYGEQNSHLKNPIHKKLNSGIVYCMRFLLKWKESHNEKLLSYLWRYYQNLLQQGLLFLSALLLGCNNAADNNQDVSDTQKVEVKSIKEYDTMTKIHFRPYIPNQTVLFPQRIDEDIAENDPLRMVDALVGSLNLENFRKLYKECGRNPI